MNFGRITFLKNYLTDAALSLRHQKYKGYELLRTSQELPAHQDIRIYSLIWAKDIDKENINKQCYQDMNGRKD